MGAHPAHPPSDSIIKHEGYALKYNEEHEQADWVAYQLTAKEVRGKQKRTDNFREDPSVKTGSATLDDYRGSGYDRGHLIPAGDAKWSKQAMSDTFYLSNMSPQLPEFNRGIWKELEGKVRDWAVENEEIYVVTGPMLNQPPLARIGRNSVSVPVAYFKVLLDNREPGLKAIAFILPNQGSSKPLSVYAVTVDRAEEITGIDFFPDLPDEIENSLEAELNLREWGLNESAKRYTPKVAEKTLTEPVSKQNDVSDRVHGVDTDRAIIYAVVILGVVLVVGVIVLVVAVRMNRNRLK